MLLIRFELTDVVAQKAFAEALTRQTAERIKEKANATIRRHEKKHKVRVYLPGEIVLVDQGKKTQIKKRRNMAKAVIIEAHTNNFYTVEFKAGLKIGEQQDVSGDLIEPMRKKERLMDEVIPVRKEIVLETKSTKKKAVAPSPKPNLPSTSKSTKKKRSEAYWYKQTTNLLTMDRQSRRARTKVFNKHEEGQI